MLIVPADNQDSEGENGRDLGDVENTRRNWNSNQANASIHGTMNNERCQDHRNGVSRINLLDGSELNNNNIQDFDLKEDSQSVGSQANGNAMQMCLRREEEVDKKNQAVMDNNFDTPQTNGGIPCQCMVDTLERLVEYLIGPVPERQRWKSLTDSIMEMLAQTVGLGDMWRFPYYCYKHGGVNYVIAYGVILVVICFPIFFTSICIAQYLSFGPTNAFSSMAPLFSGLGWAIIVTSFLVNIYYTGVLGWTLTYVYHSLRRDFPFAPNNTVSDSCSGTADNYETAKTFFFDTVIQMKTGEDFELRYEQVLSLGVAWLIVMWSLVRGIHSSSKVVYITNTFPHAILLLLLAYSYLTYPLDVFNEGIHSYLSPSKINATTLSHYDVWVDAASQALFTTCPILGGVFTLASYNELHQNTIWPSIFVISWDTATSLLCGSVVFVSLSKVSSDMDVDIGALFDSNHTLGRMGMELVFIAYPAFLADVRSPIWFVLFFLMIFALGIDSSIVRVETIITALFDNFKRLRNRYFPTVCGVVSVMFLLGFPICTGAGFYIVECMHVYTCKLSIPLLGITQIILVCYVFGFSDLMGIIRNKLKVTIPMVMEWYLLITLKFISPAIFLSLVVMAAFPTEAPAPEKDPLPEVYIVAGWILAIAPFLLVPAFAVYKCIRMRNKDWRQLLTPTADFRPAYLREHPNRPDMWELVED